MVQTVSISPQVQAGLHPAHATSNSYLNGMLWADARYVPGKATCASKPLRHGQPLGLMEQWVDMLDETGLTVDFAEYMDPRGAQVRLKIYAEEKIFREFPVLSDRELPLDADDAFAIGVLHSLFSANQTYGHYISRNSLSEQAWLKLFGEYPESSTPTRLKVPARVYAEHPGFQLLHECVEDHLQTVEEGRAAITEELDESLDDPKQRSLMIYRTAYPKLLWSDMARLAKYSSPTNRFIVSGTRGTRSFNLFDGPDEALNFILRKGLQSIAETNTTRDHAATGNHDAEDKILESIAKHLLQVRGKPTFNTWYRVGKTRSRHDRVMLHAFGIGFQNMGIDCQTSEERVPGTTTYYLEVNLQDFHRFFDVYPELPQGSITNNTPEVAAFLASLFRIYNPIYFMGRYVRASGGGFRHARSLPGVRDAGVKTHSLTSNPFAKQDNHAPKDQDEPEPKREAPEPEPIIRNILHRNPWA